MKSEKEVRERLRMMEMQRESFKKSVVHTMSTPEMSWVENCRWYLEMVNGSQYKMEELLWILDEETVND